VPIGIYRKTAPTKSTVLGADPPPWRKVNFYRFFMIFAKNRAFNAAGKTVTKIGIYALPPPKSGPKSEFLSILSIFPVFGIFLIICDPFVLNLIFFKRRAFNLSRPNLSDEMIFYLTIGNINYKYFKNGIANNKFYHYTIFSKINFLLIYNFKFITVTIL
jgi:hypothetical protein